MDDETTFRAAVFMLAVLIGLAALGLSVGYGVTAGAEATIVGYSLTAKLAWIFGSLSAMFAGWKIRERSQEVGYGILCIVPMVLFFALPRVLVDQVRVDKEGFAEREWRFFWHRTTEIKFSDYKNLIYQVRIVQGRKGPHEEHQLICRPGADPSRQKVLAAGGMLQKALPAIAEYGEPRGAVLKIDAP